MQIEKCMWRISFYSEGMAERPKILAGKDVQTFKRGLNSVFSPVLLVELTEQLGWSLQRMKYEAETGKLKFHFGK